MVVAARGRAGRRELGGPGFASSAAAAARRLGAEQNACLRARCQRYYSRRHSSLRSPPAALAHAHTHASTHTSTHIHDTTPQPNLLLPSPLPLAHRPARPSSPRFYSAPIQYNPCPIEADPDHLTAARAARLLPGPRAGRLHLPLLRGAERGEEPRSPLFSDTGTRSLSATRARAPTWQAARRVALVPQ